MEYYSILPFSLLECLPFGLYLEDIVPENYYFRWPYRTIMQHIYQKLLKEGIGNHKYRSLIGLKYKLWRLQPLFDTFFFSLLYVKCM